MLSRSHLLSVFPRILMFFKCFLVLTLVNQLQCSDDYFEPTRIFTVHCISRNIGDEYSTPVQFFPGLAKAIKASFDIWWPAPEIISKYAITKSDMIIIGGGGLLRHNSIWTSNIVEYCIYGTCIFWAPGYNRHFDYSMQDAVDINHVMMHVSGVVTLRDFFSESPGFDYEPMLDVSCFLHELKGGCSSYDAVPRGKLGGYLHADLLAGDGTDDLLAAIDHDDILHNSCSNVTEVIEFLCSYETIVTSSYHGLLWATYLNKPVYVTNIFSEKFLYLPFQVPLFAPKVAPLSNIAVINGTALKESCMAANYNFYKQFVEKGVVSVLANSDSLEDNNDIIYDCDSVHSWSDEIMDVVNSTNPLLTAIPYGSSDSCFKTLRGLEISISITLSHR